jgi:hypothetical protein
MDDERAAAEGGTDFEGQMELLSKEAERLVAAQAAGADARVGDEAWKRLSDVLGGFARAIQGQGEAIVRLEGRIGEVSGGTAGEGGGKEAVVGRLFDAMHAELRGYKDGFLFDALQKPLVIDLIRLYDDLRALHGDVLGTLQRMEGCGEMAMEIVRATSLRIDHFGDAVLEMLARTGVERMEVGGGKFDRARQKISAIERSSVPEEEGDVVAVVRPGFMWRGRVIRPEEVVIRRYAGLNGTVAEGGDGGGTPG